MNLSEYIRNIPNFPKEGIIFKDITPLLANSDAFQYSIDKFANYCIKYNINAIVGVEARGFIFASAVAYKLGIKLILVRKKGKLPYKTIEESYDLEYGSDSLEIHIDSCDSNDRVLILDDVLATGGTIVACKKLIEKKTATLVACAFLMELSFLNGKEKLEETNTFSLITY